MAGTGLVLMVLAGSLTMSGQAVAGEAGVSPDREDGLGCAMTRTGEYAEARPGEAGLDPAKLAEALDFANLHGSFSIKVFRHGCLVGEGLRDPLFERAPANNWGQAKTVTALVTGIAADMGYVDIDAPIGTYLPADLGDEAHRTVTLRHLLWASSGVEVNQVRGLNFYGDQSRAREFFTMPIVHEPGTYYYYDQTATSVITYVVQHAIWRHEPGLDFQDFVQRELFDELGIPLSAWWWQRDRAGTTTGYSQLFLRPLEFGRLGELILNDGVYQDSQVVSAAYMGQFGAPAPTNCGYGFLVFLNSCGPGEPQFDVGVPTRREIGGLPWIASAPADMVFTDGVGTRTYVIPSLDMVVTRTGEQEFDAVPALLAGNGDAFVPGRTGAQGTHEFFRLLMAAVTDMPAGVRATIANSGEYDRRSRNGFDATHWVHPLDAAPGTYLSVGPGAPEGCDPTGCRGEANDGYQQWIGDVPRTIPGTLGMEERPDGHRDAP
ncbi:MAG: serine hydrolase domain-containing protein [Acidimicrobiia bacterium]